MHQAPALITRELVLIGGGHGHVHTLKMFGMKPMEGVRVTLITRDIETPYSGMLPGFVAGHYTRQESHIDLGRLCSFSGVRLLHTEACGLDTTEKLIYCKDGRPPIRYDIVSIDVGISPRPLPKLLSTSNPSITAVKPIDGFAARWDCILLRALEVQRGAVVRIVIVGGGGGGVELSFAVQHRLSQELRRAGKDCGQVQVALVQRGGALMPSHNETVREMVQTLLAEKGIVVYRNADVVDVDTATGELIASDGTRIQYDEAIWCTDAVAQPWISECAGLATTEDGFICVKATLESTSTPDVFACGDVAQLHHPRPKAGVFAVRAGPPLTANLRRRLLNEPLEDWVPQEEFLGIIGTGDGHAIASKGKMGTQGDFLWTLKDKIDRTWMAGYQDLPDKEEMMLKMAQEQQQQQQQHSSSSNTGQGSAGGGSVLSDQASIDLLSKAKMRCGGCGSKVGAALLQRALERVKHLNVVRAEVVAGTGDDAALVRAPLPGTLLVQTLDYFRNFVSDPYLFGRIAANHALSDIYAMNGEPVSALALCVIPFGPERVVEETLVQVLAGVLHTLRAENCALVGGHTSEGAELATGLAANGVVDPARVFPKGPLLSGHVLVLTKALGTGTIMAADMRAKARGKWVQEALASMVQSNARAAKILQTFSCSACTDVTGFGLMGHLLEMIQFGGGSRVGGIEANTSAVQLSLSALPLLPGAAECVRQGILSSLHPENIRCARAVDNPAFADVEACRAPYTLCFDPQTAGGLLAAVPAHLAAAALDELHQNGYLCAQVIGRVVDFSSSSSSSLSSCELEQLAITLVD